jgi:sporulation protein YlmC with PRC-barrel domain
MVQQPSLTALGLALPLALALCLPALPIAADEPPADEPLQAVGSRTVSMHSLMELDVVTADGETLGEPWDLVVDPIDGRLVFVVVQHGGNILGLGEQRVGIPWHRVAIDGEARQFRLDMTLEDVETTPAWEGERTEGAGLGAAPIDQRPDQGATGAD